MELQTDLVDSVQSILQAAAQSRQTVLWGLALFAIVGATQLFLILWTGWRLREIGRMSERLSRLADGLALLTDTTEIGFATIGKQVAPVHPPAPKKAKSRTASKVHVAKRVVAAAMEGDNVASIARNELMSESEVRLHLALAGSGSKKNRISLAQN